jgi:hypothetical protein
MIGRIVFPSSSSRRMKGTGISIARRMNNDLTGVILNAVSVNINKI